MSSITARHGWHSYARNFLRGSKAKKEMRFFATLVLSLTFACSVDVSKANVQCESNSDCTLVNAQNICDMCLDTALAFEENENLFDELSSARNFCLPADCEVTGAAICERNICTFVSFVELEA